MIGQVVNLDLASMELSVGTFTDGQPTDIYKAEAAKIFNVPEAQVTPLQRTYAKQQAYLKIYQGDMG